MLHQMRYLQGREALMLLCKEHLCSRKTNMNLCRCLERRTESSREQKTFPRGCRFHKAEWRCDSSQQLIAQTI